MRSFLDQLEETRTDVSLLVRPDISGAEFHFEPLKYRYLLAVPFEPADIELNDDETLGRYVSDIDYLMDGYTDRHQTMLRSIIKPEHEHFYKLPAFEYAMVDDVLIPSIERKYLGMSMMFVQFDIERDWTHRKIHRFMEGLAKILDIHERVFLKPVCMFRRRADVRGNILISDGTEMAINRQSLFDSIVDGSALSRGDYSIYAEFNNPSVVVNPDGDGIRIVPDQWTIDKVKVIRHEWDECILNKNIADLNCFLNYSSPYDYPVASSTIIEQRAGIVMNLDLKMNGSAMLLPKYKKFVSMTLNTRRTHDINKIIRQK